MKKNCIFPAIVSLLIINSCVNERDYALLDSKNEWSHHFSYGSPSWDSFEHVAENPVYSGYKGMEWPVNGFLFNDPASKNWYLYIGEYRQNYNLVKNSKAKNCNCVILKSSDKGKTWSRIGDLFPPDMLCYDSLHIQVPDVMVVYEEGKYHMIFDWITNNTTWTELDETGLGYAVADNPEGPFVVSAKPLKINTQYRNNPLLGRYWRMYAPMMVRRNNDWVILYMMDTSPARSWALAASTSKKPEGPYSDPVLLRNVEEKTSYPPLMEYFPAFRHKEYLYFPATSVAVNRDYQILSRVKPEDVMDKKKWEILSAGSVWHSKNTDNEYSGIWGQTFTGFVDNMDSIYVMYPSKNRNNYGTINLAKASLNNLQRKRGFALSSCEGGSFTYIKKGIDLTSLNMDFTLEGTMKIVWDFNKPLDIKNMWGKFSFEGPEGEFKEIEVTPASWKVNYNSEGNTHTLDSGKIQNWNETINNLQLRNENGYYFLIINDQKCWKGEFTSNPGVIGIMLAPHSQLITRRFDITGKHTKAKLKLGCNEALLNSGNEDKDWDIMDDTIFISGYGAISKRDSCFAKWNFEGTGFDIYLPKGPLFGSVSVYIDEQLSGEILLKNDRNLSSSIVFKSKTLIKGAHSVYLESMNGLLPLDCIEVSF